MRATENMMALFHGLGSVLEKYLRISKVPLHVGGGETLFPSEVHLLSRICLKQGASVTAIARHFGVTKAAASQMVGKLVDKGFLQKERDPDKGSRILITPTAKGLAAHKEHMAFHERHDKPFLDYLASLSQEQFDAYLRFTEHMNQWMDSYCRERQPKVRNLDD